MNYRRLGKTGVQVSEIGYGAWGIGQNGWIGDKDTESLQALHKATELGLNFIDTKGAQFLAPGSTSGIAGVSVNELKGKLWVHFRHLSDPLSSSLHGGHALDAFEVWCVLVHGGNKARALAAAARLLG